MDPSAAGKSFGRARAGRPHQSCGGRRASKKNALQPWRVKSWCIPKASAPFVAKMEDVLDVYQRPYDPKRPQVCLDEARKELHSTPKGTLPSQPGQPARQDYEYARHGTASLFVWVEPLTGRRKVRVTARQTGFEFAEQLRLLVDEDYPEAEQLVLVVDNLKTHSPACLYERFTPDEARRIARKIEWHYTPEHGSWLNIAECELSVLERQCLARRLSDIDTLKREVAAWEQKRNQAQVTIDWRFTTADARIKLKRLYPVLKEQKEQKAA
ncbi:MAG TPA: IS630 family transposase [Pseudolabrys sp.]|nr:IS630 family transposase [Pseudolabrys sp.]